MDAIALPDAIEPDEWFVVFHTKANGRFINRLAFGRFKHVSAFAYVPGFRLWLHYDAQWTGMRLRVIGHDTLKAQIGDLTRDCVLLKMKRRHVAMPVSTRFGFYCVTAVKHLIGVRCRCLRPDGLYRRLIAEGAEIVHGQQPAAAIGRS